MTLTSLWHDRHARIPLKPGEVGGRYDVVVVGGGLTGVTTALLLGRAGKSVLLLEARSLGAVTTGGSTAKLSLLQGKRLSEISEHHPRELLAKYVEGNLEAQAWVARFCDDHGVASQRRPAYSFAFTADGADTARREGELAREAGLAATWRDQLPLPFPTRGGTRLDDQLQLDPVELVVSLGAEAARHGVEVVEGVRVEKVSGRRPVRVTTSAGEVVADTIVLATNTPILDRGGFFARTSAMRSYGLAFRTVEPVVDAMSLSVDEPSRSLRDTPGRDGESVLLVGGNGHPTGRGGSTVRRLDQLRDWTHQWWPDAEETHAWSAQDYVPHHGLPYAGPILPGSSEVLVAGGYAKWGMTNGVAAALVLTARILGGRIDWAPAYSTAPGGELPGLATAARENGTVGLELARGWIRPLLPARDPDEGQGVVRRRGLRRPAAVSLADGVERSVSAVCTHLGGIVDWNDAERSWDCPLHGSRFDHEGTLLEGPATCGLRALV